MGGVWEEPNVDDCTCTDENTTTSGVSLMWSSTPVGTNCNPLLSYH